MSLDLNDVILVCPHFRRSLFFEDGMWRLWDAGLKNIWVLQTNFLQANGSIWGQYSGPQARYWTTDTVTWEDALSLFQHNLKGEDYKYVILVDFDVFFSGAEDLIAILNEMHDEGYSYVGRSAGWDYRQGRKNLNIVTPEESNPLGNTVNGKYIHHLPDLAKNDNDRNTPDLITNEQIATCLEIFSKEVFESFSETTLQKFHRIIHKTIQSGAKMGVYHTMGKDKTGHVHNWSRQWFHHGGTTYFYRHVEYLHRTPASAEALAKSDWYATFGPKAMGGFLKQVELYGFDAYGLILDAPLKEACEQAGGHTKCRAAWDEWVQGTPMETWSRYKAPTKFKVSQGDQPARSKLSRIIL